MLRDLLGDAITKEIKQLYLELSGGVYGALQRERILESRLEQLMTLSCAEAEFKAKIVTGDIKKTAKLLKLTKDVIKYFK